MQRSIVLFEVVTEHEILFQSDTIERTDERNLSTPKKTTLVLFLNPARTKFDFNPDRGVILVERQNNSQGSSNVLNPGTKTTRSLAISDRNQFEYFTSTKQFSPIEVLF